MTDLSIIRDLIRLARESGWLHDRFGMRDDRQHIWWPSSVNLGPRVEWYRGELSYRTELGSSVSRATVRPESAEEVRGLLLLVRVLQERDCVPLTADALARTAAEFLAPDSLPDGVEGHPMGARA